MINLTKLALESEEFSFLEKISYLIGPELYHSENIEDFKNNRGKIKVPLSRGFLEKKANIIIFNISIEKIRDTEFYEIRDDSGKLPLIWHNGKGGFSYCSAYTFEMAQEEQGLENGDWVDQIAFEYYVRYKFSVIKEIRKYPSGKKFDFANSKKSLIEQAKKLIPEFAPDF